MSTPATLQALPDELVSEIALNLDLEASSALRRTCKLVEQNSRYTFGIRFFSYYHLVLDDRGVVELQALIDTERFTKYVEFLAISIPHADENESANRKMVNSLAVVPKLSAIFKGLPVLQGLSIDHGGFQLRDFETGPLIREHTGHGNVPMYGRSARMVFKALASSGIQLKTVQLGDGVYCCRASPSLIESTMRPGNEAIQRQVLKSAVDLHLTFHAFADLEPECRNDREGNALKQIPRLIQCAENLRSLHLSLDLERNNEYVIRDMAVPGNLRFLQELVLANVCTTQLPLAELFRLIAPTLKSLRLSRIYLSHPWQNTFELIRDEMSLENFGTRYLYVVSEDEQEEQRLKSVYELPEEYIDMMVLDEPDETDEICKDWVMLSDVFDDGTMLWHYHEGGTLSAKDCLNLMITHGGYYVIP